MSNQSFSSIPKALWNYIKTRAHILFLALMMEMLVEYLNRGSVYKTLDWVYQQPLELLLNYIMVLGLFLLFAALIGRTRIAFWILSGILLVVGLVSGIKFKMLGLPLLPWDIFQTSEATDIVQYLNGLVNWKILLVIFVYFALAIILIRKVPNFKIKVGWIERLIFVCLAVLIFTGVYYDKPVKIRSAFDPYTIPWDQAANYDRNGLILTTALNLDYIFVNEPENYSQQTISKLVDGIPKQSYPDNGKKPNVIVILSEAFWDPTIVKDIKFNEDPLPTLHEVQKTHPHGTILSPQFGGGTANVEFEVLTGNSMRFMPQGSLAYIQYVNHEVDSLAGIFARKGYNTTAVNPFHNWFYNSRTVYKNFGFHNFISSEFFTPDYKGPYLSDKSVTDKIIEAADNSDKPSFIFANTMQNHAPFDKDRYSSNGGNTFTVSGDMSQESRDILETYTTGIHDSDKMIKTLTDHFTQKGEPTIIIFFGDHLPLMGDNYSVYKDIKYISEDDPDFVNKMYSTPFFVWDNFLPQNNEQLHMSPSYLGAYMLNRAQIEGSYYTDFLMEMYKKYPVIPPENMYDEMKINKDDLKPYNMLQYDIMFGQQFGYEKTAIQDKIVDQNFVLGYGEMKINEASPVQTDSSGNGTITLKGSVFVPEMSVLINGEKVTAKYVDKNTVIASVPKEWVKKPRDLEIQTVIIDTKDVEISKSNKFVVKAGQ
ncbi:sulfatase-like hydrolase/transferase [Paenibacillus larvae]